MEDKYDWLQKKPVIKNNQDIQSCLNSSVICFTYVLDKAASLPASHSKSTVRNLLEKA